MLRLFLLLYFAEKNMNLNFDGTHCQDKAMVFLNQKAME